MKRVLVILLLVFAIHTTVSAQYSAIRINALGLATGSVNAGVDVAVSEKWSVDVSGYWNPSRQRIGGLKFWGLWWGYVVGISNLMSGCSGVYIHQWLNIV